METLTGQFPSLFSWKELSQQESEFQHRQRQLLNKAAMRFVFFYACLCLVMGPILIVHFFFSEQHQGIHGFDRAVIPLFNTVTTFFGSLLFAYQYRNNKASELWLYLLVIWSPLVYLTTTFNNVYFPAGNNYPGLLYLSDTIILIFLIFWLPMLQSIKLVVIGGSLYGLALYLCLLLEKTLYGDQIHYALNNYTLWASWIVLAVLLSVLFTGFMHRLVRDSALTTIKTERARQSLEQLMQEHHDAHSVLASAELNLDLLDRTQSELDLQPLRDDLTLLKSVVQSIKQEAYEEILDQELVIIPDLDSAIKKYIKELRKQYPVLMLHLVPLNERCSIRFSEGEVGLRRVIQNIVANSFEGDGTSSANELSLTLNLTGNVVDLLFEDNGPGFPLSVLNEPGKSTKIGGTGSGLNIIRRLVYDSKGTVAFFNAAPDSRAVAPGANIRISLPLSE